MVVTRISYNLTAMEMMVNFTRIRSKSDALSHSFKTLNPCVENIKAYFLASPLTNYLSSKIIEQLMFGAESNLSAIMLKIF